MNRLLCLVGFHDMRTHGRVDTDTIAKTVGSGPDLGDRPVVVLAAGQNEGMPDDVWAEWQELLQQAATLSSNSVHAVVEDSDHAIPLRNPAAIVAATTAVVESIRGGNAPLDGCPDELTAAGATCAEAGR